MDSDVNIGMNVSGETVTSNIAKTTVMSGDTNLENSLDNKNAIVPKETELTNASNNFTYNAPADSFSIIRLKTGNGGSKAYISGYEDGTFRPDNTITRAEAAAIIASVRLILTKIRRIQVILPMYRVMNGMRIMSDMPLKRGIFRVTMAVHLRLT